MIFVELIVNRPIRRSFRRDQAPSQAPDPLSDPAARFDPLSDIPFGGYGDDGGLLDGGMQVNEAAQQLFHYHLPLELEAIAQPGHLVWVPFGAQEVQGFIVRRSDSAPVPTRPVLRLARPEPVLTPVQMALAAWIADYYVAPISEAVKLFLPPGLLSKQDGQTSVRAKREVRITLAVTPAEARRRLPTLGRETQQTRVLAWLLEQSVVPSTPATSIEATPSADETILAVPIAAVQQACHLKSMSTLKTLEKQGLITIGKNTAANAHPLSAGNDGVVAADEELPVVRLAVAVDVAKEALLTMRGAAKFRPLVEALIHANRPLWKSEFYTMVDADLAQLRALQQAGLITMQEEIRFRDPLADRTYVKTEPPRFTTEQEAVWQQIQMLSFPQAVADENVSETTRRESGQQSAMRQPVAPKFLLHGVTGSGKTEIYLRAIAETLKRGRQAIVLVPEIALTPQTVARFAGRFPGKVTVIHSGLSAGERYDVWRHLRAGEFDIVVGPRSALFAPLKKLGLIILDEEHESSYKQNAEAWGSFTVFYDARVVAAQLADRTNSTLIYGSATPSLEQYTATQNGELVLLEMLRRVVGHGPITQTAQEVHEGAAVAYAELPPVEIVDMRQELRAGHRSILSRALLSALHATIDAGEQAILFLNRRGTRTFVMCRDCGAVQECDRCDVPLTYHENTNILICHHCNRRVPIPDICPECESKRIKYFGSGTQRLEELIQQVVPHAQLLRWDADTAAGRGSHEEILRRFGAHEADILVGTQMIAKGLDFPLVTLVGVVAADIGLYLPDFRSGERTFQLLTQVAGRAGRSARGGRVVIQSYKPEHYAIQSAAQHDYQAFYAREIMFRLEHGYPPVRNMARLIYWDKKLEKAQEASAAMAELLRGRLEQLGVVGEGAVVLGPAPAFFARYRGYYRWQVILRAPWPAQILRSITIPFGWRIDIDPVSML